MGHGPYRMDYLSLVSLLFRLGRHLPVRLHPLPAWEAVVDLAGRHRRLIRREEISSASNHQYCLKIRALTLWCRLRKHLKDPMSVSTWLYSAIQNLHQQGFLEKVLDLQARYRSASAHRLFSGRLCHANDGFSLILSVLFAVSCQYAGSLLTDR